MSILSVEKIVLLLNMSYSYTQCKTVCITADVEGSEPEGLLGPAKPTGWYQH